jgi:hypothetical protein
MLLLVRWKAKKMRESEGSDDGEREEIFLYGLQLII